MTTSPGLSSCAGAGRAVRPVACNIFHSVAVAVPTRRPRPFRSFFPPGAGLPGARVVLTACDPEAPPRSPLLCLPLLLGDLCVRPSAGDAFPLIGQAGCGRRLLTECDAAAAHRRYRHNRCSIPVSLPTVKRIEGKARAARRWIPSLRSGRRSRTPASCSSPRTGTALACGSRVPAGEAASRLAASNDAGASRLAASASAFTGHASLTYASLTPTFSA